jgi:uncharacterized membrane protein YvlD (DUF360 family)
MRRYLKTITISALSVYLAFTLIPTVSFGTNPQNIPIIFGGFLLISILIRPIFLILFLPFNIVTSSLSYLILNFAFLFALTKFLPDFSIDAYSFAGFAAQGYLVPAFNLNSLETIAALAVIITLIQKLLEIIFKK